MDVGDAKVKLKVEGQEQVNAALNGVGNSVQNMSRQFKMAGAAITAFGVAMVAAMGMVVKSHAEAGDQIGKLSKATGISTEALSVLKYTAELSGSSLDTLGRGAMTLQKYLVQASDGMATYVREFDRLNLSVDELMAMSPEEAFYKVAEALADMEDVTVRNAAAQTLLGRAGKELLPMFDLGAEGIREMADEGQRFAHIFSVEDTEACEAFNDSLTRLKFASGEVMAIFADEVMPMLTDFAVKIAEIVSKVTDWLEEHPTLNDILSKFALILGGLTITGGPMLLLIGFIPQIVTGFTKLVAFINTTLIPAIGRAITAFIAWAASMGPAGWAMIIGGIAATSAGIIAMGRLLGEELGTVIPEGLSAKELNALAEAMGLDIRLNLEKFKGELGEAGEEINSVIDTMDDFTTSVENATEALSKFGGEIPLEEIGTKSRPYTLEEFLWHLQHPGKPIPEGLQAGGVVTRPTLAMLGEKGAEAVVPLKSGMPLSPIYNITLKSEVFWGNDAEAARFVRNILDRIRIEQRRTIGVSA